MVGLIFTHRMAEGRETSRRIANERPAEAVLDHFCFGAIVVVVVVVVSVCCVWALWCCARRDDDDDDFFFEKKTSTIYLRES